MNTVSYIIYTFLIIVVVYQLFYLFGAIIISFQKNNKKIKTNRNIEEKLSVVIPLFNCKNTINKTLKSVIDNNLNLLNKIIIVNDNSTDGSALAVENFIKNYPNNDKFIFINLNRGRIGKVETILTGLKYIKTENILLLDADIILEKNAIERLYQFHIENNNFCTSCLVYPYRDSSTNVLTSQIIGNDKLYRQNILKLVRDVFGVANFPGCIGIVSVADYKKYFRTCFLEDLKATYKIIEYGKHISVLPVPLAFEVERQSFKGLFLQRTRWTLGSIYCFGTLVRAIIKSKNFIKGIILMSYPIMWHLQHCMIIFGLIILFFNYKYWVFSIPLMLYFLQILLSTYKGRLLFKNSFIGICLHCILFPVISTLSLFGAIYNLILKRSFYFTSESLFERI